MSLQTHSTKRRRIYQRAFDHDEARRLREEGWGYGRLADYFGVSDAAVRRVCDPVVRERMDAQTKRWVAEKRRQPCKGGCGTLVWMTGKARSGYCTSCWAAQRTTGYERDGELRCTKCGEWKADEEFGREVRPTRRGHRSWCRSCDTARRREYRQKNSERERAASNRSKRRRAMQKGTARMSEYLVLRKNGNGWEEIATVDASSVLYAIEEGADGEGTYTAVKPAHVMTVEPTTAFKVVKG